MPPKRSHDNVDVENEGDRSDEPEMKTIQIVTSEKEEKFSLVITFNLVFVLW